MRYRKKAEIVKIDEGYYTVREGNSDSGSFPTINHALNYAIRNNYDVVPTKKDNYEVVASFGSYDVICYNKNDKLCGVVTRSKDEKFDMVAVWSKGTYAHCMSDARKFQMEECHQVKKETQMPTEKQIDWSKPVQTIEGKPAHYVGRGVDGLRVIEQFNCQLYYVDENGKSSMPSRHVSNVPQKHWVNLYWIKPTEEFVTRSWLSKELAEKDARLMPSEYVFIETREVTIPND